MKRTLDQRLSRGLAAVLSLFGLGGCSNHPAPSAKREEPHRTAEATPSARKTAKVSTIDLNALSQLQQSGKVLLLDVRPPFVTPFGRIPGAITWPRFSFSKELSQHEPEVKAALAAGRTVVLYCTDAGCPDSRAVAEKLAALGYPVSVLQGGYSAWKEAGLPVE